MDSSNIWYIYLVSYSVQTFFPLKIEMIFLKFLGHFAKKYWCWLTAHGAGVKTRKFSHVSSRRYIVLRGHLLINNIWCGFTWTFTCFQHPIWIRVHYYVRCTYLKQYYKIKLYFSRRWYPQVLRSWEVRGTVASFGAQRFYNLLRSLLLFYANIYVSVHYPTWYLFIIIYVEPIWSEITR